MVPNAEYGRKGVLYPRARTRARHTVLGGLPSGRGPLLLDLHVNVAFSPGCGATAHTELSTIQHPGAVKYRGTSFSGLTGRFTKDL
jgi:hypothetical protein